MSVVTDYPDYSPHVAHAQQIAATGVPLLANQSQLLSDAGRVIAATASKVYPAVAVTQTGYHASVSVSYPAAATVPYISALFDWLDPATGLEVWSESYSLIGNTAPGKFTSLGTGLARSGQLKVTLTNLDPAQAATVTIVVNQDSIPRSKTQWQWSPLSSSNANPPATTLAGMALDETTLGVLNSTTVLASSTANILFGMAPGQLIQLAGNTAGVPAASIALTAMAMPASAYFNNGILLRQVLTTAGFDFTFIGPRAPVQLTVTNAATSGALTISGMMTAQSA